REVERDESAVDRGEGRDPEDTGEEGGARTAPRRGGAGDAARRSAEGGRDQLRARAGHREGDSGAREAARRDSEEGEVPEGRGRLRGHRRHRVEVDRDSGQQDAGT